MSLMGAKFIHTLLLPGCVRVFICVCVCLILDHNREKKKKNSGEAALKNASMLGNSFSFRDETGITASRPDKQIFSARLRLIAKKKSIAVNGAFCPNQTTVNICEKPSELQTF